MQIHHFYRTAHADRARAMQVVCLPNVTPDTFITVHGGQWLDAMPDGYEPCRAGFRFWRDQTGEVLGVKFDPSDPRAP